MNRGSTRQNETLSIAARVILAARAKRGIGVGDQCARIVAGWSDRLGPEHAILASALTVPTAPWSQELYIRAYRFAAHAHRWQRVPGTRLPYIMHLSFTAMEIQAAIAATDVREADLAIQCALLHDVLEDTMVRYGRLVDEFGEDIALGVQALTLNKRLTKQEQMPECLERIRLQRHEIWMVKLADRITNLQPPPKHWKPHRIRAYHEESGLILAALKDASPFLAARLAGKLEEYARFVV
jgi:(p)ppGpp synthase/HD superfamily hydrolase